MKRIVFSIGALPFACLFGSIYDYCLSEPLCLQANGFLFDFHWFLVIAFGMVFFGLVLDLLPAAMFMFHVPNGLPKFSTSRQEAIADLEQLYKDLTGQYSCEELQQMEWEELRNRSQHLAAAQWWSGSNDETYIDGDGYARYVESGKIIGGE